MSAVVRSRFAGNRQAGEAAAAAGRLSVKQAIRVGKSKPLHQGFALFSHVESWIQLLLGCSGAGAGAGAGYSLFAGAGG